MSEGFYVKYVTRYKGAMKRIQELEGRHGSCGECVYYDVFNGKCGHWEYLRTLPPEMNICRAPDDNCFQFKDKNPPQNTFVYPNGVKISLPEGYKLLGGELFFEHDGATYGQLLKEKPND